MHRHLDYHQHIVSNSSDRTFGFVFAIFFLVISLVPFVKGESIRYWAVFVGVFFLVISLVSPNVLTPLNKVWSRLGQVLHKITNPFFLGLIYFGAVIPTGIVLRLLSKDPLRIRRDKTIESYWVKKEVPAPSPESMKQQF